MKYVYLVDFDNYFEKRDLNLYSVEKINYLLQNLISTTVNVDDFENGDFVEIRLYNGWHCEEVLTTKGSIMSTYLSQINLFPISIDSSKIIKGKVVLADSLSFVPDYFWRDTLKTKKGLSFLRIDNNELSESCQSNKSLCPPLILKTFAKKKERQCAVHSCSDINEDVFVRSEQKMVDTMIACDLITFSMEEDIAEIILVSDDVDHFPALAVSSQMLLRFNNETKIQLLIKNKRSQEAYRSILSRFKIQITYNGY